MTELTLPDWAQPGVTFRYDFGPANPFTGRKFEIRGIVDGHAVIREFWRGKQRWNYSVEGPTYFIAFADHIRVGRKRRL